MKETVKVNRNRAGTLFCPPLLNGRHRHVGYKKQRVPDYKIRIRQSLTQLALHQIRMMLDHIHKAHQCAAFGVVFEPAVFRHARFA